jgi:hypothetical protein
MDARGFPDATHREGRCCGDGGAGGPRRDGPVGADFTGTVTSTEYEDWPNPIVKVGDPISGSFTYDLSRVTPHGTATSATTRKQSFIRGRGLEVCVGSAAYHGDGARRNGGGVPFGGACRCRSS